MAIRLSAPIQVENLLPYDFKFRIYDKTTDQDYSDNFLSKGEITSLYIIELNHILLLSITIEDTGIIKYIYLIDLIMVHFTHISYAFLLQDYTTSEFSIISSPNSEYSIDNTLSLTDSEGLKLNLRIHYTLVIIN